MAIQERVSSLWKIPVLVWFMAYLETEDNTRRLLDCLQTAIRIKRLAGTEFDADNNR